MDTETLPPGARIPSRNELISTYGVTRITIEKAVSALIAEGYLSARGGSGTYIAEHMPPVSMRDGNTSRTWGVMMPNIAFDIYPEVFRGIEDVASRNNIHVVLGNSDNELEKEIAYLDQFMRSGFDGLIVTPTTYSEENPNAYQALAQAEIPLVFCSRAVPGVKAPRVFSNNYYGGFIATRHLINNGYTRIGYLSWSQYSHAQHRYAGYMAALKEADMPYDPALIFFNEPKDTERGYVGAKQLLSLSEPPDALVCFNDAVAYGAYRAATEAGYAVGQDFGLMGYDDSHLCTALPVPLSSVRYPKYETGVHAAELLLSKMDDGESVTADRLIMLMPELIVRESGYRSLQNGGREAALV